MPTAQAAPTLLRGTPALGEPYTVQLIVMGTSTYELCSAAVWKPRVLLTAAHCLTDTGASTAAASSRIFIMPPGVDAAVVYASGPIGAAPVHVTGAYLGQQYAETSKVVVGNDIAAVTLDADLAPTAFTRLADRTEITAWVRAQRETTITGYGITSPTDTAPSPPRSAQFQLVEAQTDRRGVNGWTLWSNPVNGVDTCPGDSGAPQYVTAPASTLLIGDIAGGNCNGQPRTAEAFAAISYLEVLNPALAAAGYPTIPSAPLDIHAALVAGNESIWWSAPQLSPDTAASFEVRDAAGIVLCTAQQRSCTISPTADATVRSVNAQGEGDAAPVPTPTPLQPAAPRVSARAGAVTFSLTAVEAPIVTAYRVVDQRGRVACRVVASASPLGCSARLPRGSYRFTVSSSTQAGRTLESSPSRVVIIR